MIIKMNIDGSIAATQGARVFKRSNAIQRITLFAPFNKQSSVLVNFKLPDGTNYPGIMRFDNFNVSEGLNMWFLPIEHPITELEGRVELSLEIRATADTKEILTTAMTYIYVEESISNVVVDAVDQYLNLANDALTRAQAALNENVSQGGRLANLENNDAIQDNELNNHEERIVSVEGIADTSLQNATYTASDGKLTLTRQNGIPVVIDFPLEMIIESGVFNNETRDLELTLANGQVLYIPLDSIYAKIDDDVLVLEVSVTDLQTRVSALETDNTTNKNKIGTLETTVGQHTNKLNALPSPENIITKTQFAMPEGYAPTQQKHLADKDYVDTTIEGLTGVNPGSFVTHAQLDEELNQPSFLNLTLDQPVNHITDSILDSPNEITEIQGKSAYSVHPEEYTLAQSLPNGEITEVNGQKYINVSSKVIADGDITSLYEGASLNYVAIQKPIDSSAYGTSKDNWVKIDNLSYANENAATDITNLGKIYIKSSQNFIWYYVSKDTNLEQAKTELIGKILTYELATPRYANTLGIVPVKNPVIESVGDNLFDGELESGSIATPNGSNYDNVDLTLFIRSKNYIKVSKSNSYIVSTSLGTDFVLYEYDENLNYLGYTSNNPIITKTNTSYIRFRYKNPTTLPNIINIMLNQGTTPLPYTPFNSHKQQFTGDYYKGDRIINDNGVYWDEINKEKLVLSTLTPTVTTLTITTQLRFTGLKTQYADVDFINGFDLKTGDIKGYEWNNNDLLLNIPNDEYTETYLVDNNIECIFDKLEPIKRESVLVEVDDLVFKQGNTIYLSSEKAIPTVNARGAMDVASQINQLTENVSYGNRIHKQHDDDINALKTTTQTHGETLTSHGASITQLELDIKGTLTNASYNATNGQLTFDFFDSEANPIVIDLPLELIVESGSFDDVTDEVVLTLANGNEIRIPVANLVTGIEGRLQAVEFDLEGDEYTTGLKTKVSNLENDVNGEFGLYTQVGELQNIVSGLETDVPKKLERHTLWTGSVDILNEKPITITSGLNLNDYDSFEVEIIFGSALSGTSVLIRLGRISSADDTSAIIGCLVGPELIRFQVYSSTNNVVTIGGVAKFSDTGWTFVNASEYYCIGVYGFKG